MEFNHVTLFKVPFDSTYKNVIDYHTYTKSGTILTKSTNTEASIKECRSKYFSTLTWRNVYYNHNVNKSVKVTGKFVQFSIVGKWFNTKDFNYVRLQRWERIGGVDTVVDELYCFINSMDSNNDSSEPSTMIYAEIDFWTQYAHIIELETPQQYENYAHENPKVYNGKIDDRLPSDFIMRKTFVDAIKDAIIFIKVRYDKSHSLVTNPQASAVAFDSTGAANDVYYIPYLAYYYGNVTPISGYSTSGGTYVYWGDYVAENGYFAKLNSQYTFDITLTMYTPIGVIKSSENTLIFGGNTYFKAISFSGASPYRISSTINGFLVISEATDQIGFIYASTRDALSPLTSVEQKIAEIDGTVPYNPAITDYYSSNYEIKLNQYPYTIHSLVYKCSDYNITPEPTGTSTTPVSEVYFKMANSILMKLVNTNDISNTILFSLNDADGIPVSQNAWEVYKQNSLAADIIKTIAGSAASIAGGIALAPATGGTSLVTSAAAIGVTGASFAGNIIKNKNIADSLRDVSNNSFDVIQYLIPKVKTSILKQEDINSVTSLWKKYGYPIKEVRDFTMRRFWYDYKQIKSSSLPNITNPIARKTIESVLDNGVIIWHANNVANAITVHTIGDFSINNPSNTDCTEVQ